MERVQQYPVPICKNAFVFLVDLLDDFVQRFFGVMPCRALLPGWLIDALDLLKQDRAVKGIGNKEPKKYWREYLW